METTAQYQPCPQCGSTNASKVKFTWWGGALGPSMLRHVKCNNCGTEYNGKTGKSNQTNIILYFAVTFVVALCACGGFAFFAVLMNR